VNLGQQLFVRRHRNQVRSPLSFNVTPRIGLNLRHGLFVWSEVVQVDFWRDFVVFVPNDRLAAVAEVLVQVGTLTTCTLLIAIDLAELLCYAACTVRRIVPAILLLKRCHIRVLPVDKLRCNDLRVRLR